MFEISESVGTSSDSLPSRDERLQDLEQEQGEERCATRISKSCTSTIGFANRSEDNGQTFTPDNDFDLSASVPFETDSENLMSVNTENNDPLSMESVGTNAKGGICVPVSCDQSGPSSGASSISVSSSDLLVLYTAEGTPVCSSSSSQGSSTTHSAPARGEIVNESDLRLNTGSSEEEVPGQAQLLNSTDDVTDGGNTEVENTEGQSVDSCYGVSGTTGSDTRRSPLCVSEYDSQITPSDSSDFCHLTEPVRSHVDRNPLQLQQSSNAHVQTTLRMHESVESSSSSTDWEHLGARPKSSQTQRPLVAISPPPPPPIASPVSDGLADDFFVRHSQDKVVHESMFSNGRDYSFRDDTWHGSNPPAAAAPLASPTGPNNGTLGWNGSSSDGANNVDGLLNIDHGVTGQRDYSRESYFPYVQHNTHVGQLPLHWLGFAYGSTSSGFPVVSESNNIRTFVRNSSFSAIAPGDGNAAGTSLAPVSGNADENNSR